MNQAQKGKSPAPAANREPGQPSSACADDTPKLHLVKPDADIDVEGEPHPLIPPGIYSAQYTHHQTVISFQTPKVFIHFQVVSFGEYQGTRLFRAYRVRELIGKPRKNGRCKLGLRHELFLTLCHLYQPQWTRVSSKRMRPDRISIRMLGNLIVRVSVRTVTRDYQQRPLPECLHYAVIDNIVGIEAGTLGEP